ncbi:MAG: acyl-CoA dehydrogenase [Pseudomonadota bacterium]
MVCFFISTSVIVPLALKLAGSEAQQGEVLPKIAGGEVRFGTAMSELCGARSGARVTASDGKLSGKAMFVLDVDADRLIVADNTAKLYLVDGDADGLQRKVLSQVDRTRKLGEVNFDNTPADLLPGSDDIEVARQVLNAARVMQAADTLGASQNMLDQSVAYAKQREQFNRVIASFQAVKHMCAQMAGDIQPCHAMVWYAGYALDELPDEARMTALHTKAHLSEVGRSVSKTATEVHGGMGFTDLVGLHYWFKRIGLNRQLLGAPERLRREAAVAQGLVAA